SKTAHHCDLRRRGHSGDRNRARRRIFSYPQASSPSSTSSNRTLPASAARNIVLPSKAQRPWPRPCPWRYFSVYVLSAIPALRDRNKHWCGLWEFPRNNQKKRIHPTFCPDPPHPVHRRGVPFHGEIGSA